MKGAAAMRKPTTIGKYRILQKIGRGATGEVYKALDQTSGAFVALKRIYVQHKFQEQNIFSIRQEVELLKKLRHPNIVQCLGLIEEENHFSIVLEYIDSGSLDTLVKKMGGLHQSLAVVYIEQVLKGLEYLHRQGVIHRDIKGANILVNKDGRVKLADFGVAKLISESLITLVDGDTALARAKAKRSDSIKGTPHWMDPDALQENWNATYASDIWSLGITTIEVLTGKPPLADLLTVQVMHKMQKDQYNVELPQDKSPELKDFLGLCFKKDPSERPEAHQLLEHAWIRSVNRPLLERILEHEMPEIVTNTMKRRRQECDSVKPSKPLHKSDLSNLTKHLAIPVPEGHNQRIEEHNNQQTTMATLEEQEKEIPMKRTSCERSFVMSATETAKFRDSSSKAGTRKSSHNKRKGKGHKSSAKMKLEQSMIEVADVGERQPQSTKTSQPGHSKSQAPLSSHNSSAVKLSKRESLQERLGQDSLAQSSNTTLRMLEGAGTGESVHIQAKVEGEVGRFGKSGTRGIFLRPHAIQVGHGNQYPSDVMKHVGKNKEYFRKHVNYPLTEEEQSGAIKGTHSDCETSLPPEANFQSHEALLARSSKREKSALSQSTSFQGSSHTTPFFPSRPSHPSRFVPEKGAPQNAATPRPDYSAASRSMTPFSLTKSSTQPTQYTPANAPLSGPGAIQTRIHSKTYGLQYRVGHNQVVHSSPMVMAPTNTNNIPFASFHRSSTLSRGGLLFGMHGHKSLASMPVPRPQQQHSLHEINNSSNLGRRSQEQFIPQANASPKKALIRQVTPEDATLSQTPYFIMRTQNLIAQGIPRATAAQEEFANSGSLDQDSLEREEEEETLSDEYEEQESKESLQNYTDSSEQATPTPSKFTHIYHKINRFGPSLSGHVPHAHCDLTPSITDLTPSPSAPLKDKRFYKLKQSVERLCHQLLNLVDYGPLRTPDSDESRDCEISLYQAAAELKDILRPKEYPELGDDVVHMLGFTAVSRLVEQFGRGVNGNANAKVLLELVNQMISPQPIKENTDRTLLQKALLSGLIRSLQRLHIEDMEVSVKTEVFFLLGQLFNTTSPYLVEVVTAGALELLVTLLRSKDISKGDPKAILTGLDVLVITSKLPKSLRVDRASLLVQVGAVDVLAHYLRSIVPEEEEGKEGQLSLTLYLKQNYTIKILDMFACISEGPLYARKELCRPYVWQAFRELSKNFEAKQEALTLVGIIEQLAQDERLWSPLVESRLFFVLGKLLKYSNQFERNGDVLSSSQELIHTLLLLVQKLTYGNQHRTNWAMRENLDDKVMLIGDKKPAFLQQVLTILGNFALASQIPNSVLKSARILQYLMSILPRLANQDYGLKVKLLKTVIPWVQRNPDDELLLANLEILTQVITECHSSKHLEWLLDIFVKILGFSPKLCLALTLKRDCLARLVQLLKKVVRHYEPQQGFVEHHSIKSLVMVFAKLTDNHTQKNKFLRSLKIEPTLKQIQKIATETGLDTLIQVADIVLSLHHTD